MCLQLISGAQSHDLTLYFDACLTFGVLHLGQKGFSCSPTRNRGNPSQAHQKVNRMFNLQISDSTNKI